MIQNKETRRGLVLARAMVLLILGAVFVGAGQRASGEIVLLLDPKATYLRLSLFDQARDPLDAFPIRLANFGIEAGDVLRLGSRGDHQFIGLNRPEDEAVTAYVGVFSSTQELLGPDQAHRVPGAIDTGEDFVTMMTFTQNPTGDPSLVTDIPEDFFIGGELIIEVPEGAEFLFVTTNQSRFSDDFDLDADSRLLITNLSVIPAPAALPAGLVLMGALGLRRRGRG